MKIYEHLTVGPLGCNCYIVGDELTKKAIVIDPGGDAEIIVQRLLHHELAVTAIVATHAHFDHVIAAEALRTATGAPFLLHGADRPILDWLEESGRLFLGVELGPPPEVDEAPKEDDVVRAGEVELRVVHTPGHSPGSISLVGGGVVFVGDTLFAGSVGRTDLPGGDGESLVRAVRTKLFALDDDTPVYPGHGPATTIGEEKRSNPFVGARARSWIPLE
jgi:hydroxyacylglutathione hydrolase